jgi:predicted pyridoxine 5'-phosphate oxidase superfamily flavin-nucleotide-binding protein
MTADRSTDGGFHAGELAVQQRAGVEHEAARLAGMLAPVELVGGIVGFLADRTFVVITARDAAGRLWTSPLVGEPGFLAVSSPTELTVRASIPAGDPLHALPVGQPVGAVVVEFAARRRVRINGTLARVTADHLMIRVEQAFGNCPRYIQPRVLVPDRLDRTTDDVRLGDALAPEDVELITRSDTFFLGTVHPDRGADASHRGGDPGFVRVRDGRLSWPDHPGNNMFTSFGNLAVDPGAALLFLDFATGRTLHLSGTAEVEWDAPGDDGGTGRAVRFTPERFVAGRLLAAHEAARGPVRRTGRGRIADDHPSP